MADEPQFRALAGADAKLRRIRDIRDAVTPNLGTTVLLHFTDHSVEHSDRLVNYVDQLLQTITDSRLALSPSEAFILYAGCYLHDFGLHWENCASVNCVTMYTKSRSWDTIEHTERQQIIRDTHAEISAELVIASHRSATPPIGIQLVESDEIDLIATICRAHTLEMRSTEYSQLVSDRRNIRVEFLAGLLRLADILDESQHRALPQVWNSLDLGTETLVHWWRHYYTKAVQIDHALGCITLHFQFPPSKRREYEAVVPSLQVGYISRELQHQMPVLIRNKCPYMIKTAIDESPYATALEMPEVVLEAMLRQVRKDRQDTQAALAREFAQARPMILRELDNIKQLRQQEDYDGYCFGRLAISEKLHGLGATNSAWHVLFDIGPDVITKLSGNPRLLYAVQLAEISAMDGHDTIGLRPLQECLPLVDKHPDESLKTRFYLAYAHALGMNGAYLEALGILRTLNSRGDADVQREAAARAAELHLLEGELQRATMPDPLRETPL